MYLFFDTETTGLPKNWKAPLSDINNWPRMIQLAYIVYDENEKRVHGQDMIILPENFDIPEEASKIHGITTDKAKKFGKVIGDVLMDLAYCLSHTQTVIAHNISFDEAIVGCEFVRIKKENPLERKSKICTMKAATNFCKLPTAHGFKWPKLIELHRALFSSDFDGAHDARNDIEATAKCFFEMKKRGLVV